MARRQGNDNGALATQALYIYIDMLLILNDYVSFVLFAYQILYFYCL